MLPQNCLALCAGFAGITLMLDLMRDFLPHKVCGSCKAKGRAARQGAGRGDTSACTARRHLALQARETSPLPPSHLLHSTGALCRCPCAWLCRSIWARGSPSTCASERQSCWFGSGRTARVRRGRPLLLSPPVPADTTGLCWGSLAPAPTPAAAARRRLRAAVGRRGVGPHRRRRHLDDSQRHPGALRCAALGVLASAGLCNHGATACSARRRRSHPCCPAAAAGHCGREPADLHGLEQGHWPLRRRQPRCCCCCCWPRCWAPTL